MDFKTKRCRPSGIFSIDLIIVHTKAVHEKFNLVLSVVFCNIATTCADSKALLEMQTQKPITRAMGSVNKIEMTFERYTAI